MHRFRFKFGTAIEDDGSLLLPDQTDRKCTGSVEMVVRMTVSDVLSVLNWIVPQEYGLVVFRVSYHQSKYECPFDVSPFHTILCHVQYDVCVSILKQLQCHDAPLDIRSSADRSCSL